MHLANPLKLVKIDERKVEHHIDELIDKSVIIVHFFTGHLFFKIVIFKPFKFQKILHFYILK